ncbi:nitrile hydratase subunit beta [Nocardia sp. BMG111209]|uniref:nitrile hydratase subunit beta n=1 Tax=Nocardia sp. BMG111209 TaxID=1160137 RepID=UPI00037B9222|nr:nitrile hydratase subunit beta [Nocardia sp. BMG111209]
MTGPYRVLLDASAGLAGEPPQTLPGMERHRAPWESSMQATCECLSWRGALDNLERRRAEDVLGASLYREFPVHTHPALVAAHTLLDKGLIAEEELSRKMREVRARLEED